jgi:dephospho-CoA kinase
MIVIGITGTIGSSKGTVVEYLVSKYGFKHYSARAFISEEIARRGLPDTRENMRLVANELRATHSPSFVAESLYARALEDGANAVMESLRATGEIDALRKKPGKFYLLAVDADPKLRYERILKRQSSTDNVSFEKFIAEEAKEMNDTNPAGMNITTCMAMADGHLTNNKDKDALHLQIDELIKPLFYNLTFGSVG